MKVTTTTNFITNIRFLCYQSMKHYFKTIQKY